MFLCCLQNSCSILEIDSPPSMLFADILEFPSLNHSVRALFAKFALVVAEQFCLGIA